MVYAQVEEGIDRKLAVFLGVDRLPLPLCMIIDPLDGDLSKYILKGELTEDNYIKFFEDYQ